MGQFLMSATVSTSVATGLSQVSQLRPALRQCASCLSPYGGKALTGAVLLSGLLAQNRSVARARPASYQNLIVTGSKDALGNDLTVEPSLDAGPSGVDGEVFVVPTDGRRTCPMLNQPPLTVSSCVELSSLFKMVIGRLPVSLNFRRSGPRAGMTVTDVTKDLAE